MPRYDFLCAKCQRSFELTLTMSEREKARSLHWVCWRFSAWLRTMSLLTMTLPPFTAAVLSLRTRRSSTLSDRASCSPSSWRPPGRLSLRTPRGCKRQSWPESGFRHANSTLETPWSGRFASEHSLGVRVACPDRRNPPVRRQTPSAGQMVDLSLRIRPLSQLDDHPPARPASASPLPLRRPRRGRRSIRW